MDAQQKVTEASRIQCLECGKWFRALPKHVRSAHQIDDDDYRIKHGVRKSTPLVCTEWSERAREVGKSHPNVQEQARKQAGKGPPKGFKRSATAKAQSRERDLALHRKGTDAASKVDRTAKRMESMAPWPVSVGEAAKRLGVSVTAARSFLGDAFAKGKVIRVGRGTYDLPTSKGGRPSLDGVEGPTKIMPIRLPETDKDAVKSVLSKGETFAAFARLALAKEVASRSRQRFDYPALRRKT